MLGSHVVAAVAALFFRLFSSLFFSFFIASFFAFFSRNFVLFFFLGDEREAEHKQQADSEEALHDGGYYQKVNVKFSDWWHTLSVSVGVWLC